MKKVEEETDKDEPKKEEVAEPSEEAPPMKKGLMARGAM